MALIEVPCRTDLTHYDFFMVLDGVSFKLEFRWNIRDSAWYLDIKTDDDTNVANGIKVVTNWYLLRGLRSDNRPVGQLVCFDTSAAKQEPSIDSLGARHKLFYVDEASIDTIRSGL